MTTFIFQVFQSPWEPCCTHSVREAESVHFTHHRTVQALKGESQLGEEGAKDIGKWKPVKMCSVNGWNGRCKLQLSLILILKHINLPKQ